LSEVVSLKGRDGAKGEGQAEVVRYSSAQRLSKALAIGVGGTLLGVSTIVIPGVHLISTWAIPLLSIGIAWYFYGRRGLLGAVSATCPSCGEQLNGEGGAWEDPMYVRCSACSRPFEVTVSPPV